MSIETRGEIERGRRDFFKIAAVGTFAAIAAVGGLNYYLSEQQDRKNELEWAPQVGEFILDDLSSGNNENLLVLNELSRKKFVDMVSGNQLGLYADNPTLRDATRGELVNFVLLENYGGKVLDGDPFLEKSVAFMNMVVNAEVAAKLRKAGMTAQANAWLELSFRSWPVNFKYDPTDKSGVFFPANQSLVGLALFPAGKFIQLQQHP